MIERATAKYGVKSSIFLIRKNPTPIGHHFSTPANRERFAQQGLATILGSPEETAAFVAAESKRWGDVIRRANIRME